MLSCSICNSKISWLKGWKISDGTICDDCAAKLGFFADSRNTETKLKISKFTKDEFIEKIGLVEKAKQEINENKSLVNGVFEELRTFKHLLDEGLINKEEYEIKEKEAMDNLKSLLDKLPE